MPEQFITIKEVKKAFKKAGCPTMAKAYWNAQEHSTEAGYVMGGKKLPAKFYDMAQSIKKLMAEHCDCKQNGIPKGHTLFYT